MSSFTLVSDGQPPISFFDGYVFIESGLHHWSYGIPDTEKLLNSFADNCGVFAAVHIAEDRVVIFGDPLGQYPVFYYNEGDSWIVSTDFFDISRRLPESKFNRNSIQDYLGYFTPLNGETITSGVRCVRPGQYIELKNGSFKLVDTNLRPRPGNYDELLNEASERLKNRAAALLQRVNPVAHLSGGLDSRLTLAALLSSGYRGPVFSFGGTESDDRQISAQLADRFSLSEGPVRGFHRTPDNVGGLMRSVLPFNGMKILSLSNYGQGSDFSYGETTGYFSGGLLKGFGKLWTAGTLQPFKYGKKVTSFDPKLFDSIADRMSGEVERALDLTSGNTVSASGLFYLGNRSVGHFGAHSVVNNHHFISADLLYDPLLLDLLISAPYESSAVSQGAVILDLITKVHSIQLASYPYDGRTLVRHDAAWCHEVLAPSCFDPPKIDRAHRDVIRPILWTQPSTPSNLPTEKDWKKSVLADVQQEFDFLKPVRLGTRGAETAMLPALLALIQATYQFGGVSFS